MADWKTYAKAAHNTAKKQAPAAREALRRESEAVRREGQAYTQAAKKVWQEQGKDKAAAATARAASGARDAETTMKAAARVVGKRYKQAGMTQRLLAALRDTSLIALSLGVIWFVFSRAFPIPVSWVLWALAILVVLRIIHALTHNPYHEVSPDDPKGIPGEELPENATISRRKIR